jgi:acetyl esterase/lipase
MIRNVVTPSLTVFLPDPAVATGAGVVIAPGGGFCWLTWDVEGTMLAEWLRNRGVAAFVLKYRTVDMGETEAEFEQRSHEVVEAMLNLARVDEPWNVRPVRYPWLDAVVTLAEEDAGNAVRHVREKAVPYRVAADRIGFLGFSAGGILALGLALRHDGRSRPDFIVPVYGISHDPLVVPVDAPPMFLVCAVDDDVVAPHASAICDAWRAAGKSVESHVYSCGGHGFGMRAQGLPVDSWAERFHDWLDVEGFLTPDTEEKG